MSKPESMKVDPWTDFPRQSYSFINDDFVHDKLFTLKVNTKGDKSAFNFKASLKADKGALKLSDEVKYWFNLPEGRSLYSKVKSSDYVKLHFDNGIVERWNKKWNLYATLNLTKTLSNASLRLGVAHKSEHCNSDNRLKVDYVNESNYNLTWYNRTFVTHDKFTFGNMLAYSISRTVLAKTNFLLGYKVNDKVDAFLRISNSGYKESQFKLSEAVKYLDTFIFNIIAKHDTRFKYGLEAVFRQAAGSGPFDQALLVLQHSDKKRTTKARLSSKFDLDLAFKLPCLLFKDIATTTIGVHGSNLQNDKRKFKAGIQYQFNV